MCRQRGRQHLVAGLARGPGCGHWKAAVSRRLISGTVSGIIPESVAGAWLEVTGDGAWVSVRSLS